MLLLFDIDGTLLLRAADAHRDAIHAAIRRVHRIDDLSDAHVDTAGRTDQEIVRSILLQLEVSATRIDERMPDVKRIAAAEYAERCPLDLSDHVSPGVPTLLEDLLGRDGYRLSLVTGNIESIARLKLARAGLGHFFEHGQGGFGSDHEDRSELPAIARARAGGPRGPHPRESTVVIGDTPRDIACAHADGVRCVAVATGAFRPDDLRDADTVVRSARELAAVL